MSNYIDTMTVSNATYDLTDKIINEPTVRKNIVILGDSNAAKYQDSGFLEKTTRECTIQKLAIPGYTFASTGKGIISELANITGTPDYAIVWCGNNDIASWKTGTIGKLYNNDFTMDDFDQTTAFGALNYVIAYIRKRYPLCKIIGIIRTNTYGRNKSRMQYFWWAANQIYQKWCVPVIDFELCANITEGDSTARSTFFSDSLHYNSAALERLNSMVVSTIRGNLVSSFEIPCEIYYADDASIATRPDLAKWVKENIFEGMSVAAGENSVKTFRACKLETTDALYTQGIIAGSHIVLLDNKLNSAGYNGSGMRYYHLDDSGTISEAVLNMTTYLSSGDIMALGDGDYMIQSGDRSKITHLPSTNNIDGGLYVTVRTSLSKFRYYTAYSFFGKIAVGTNRPTDTKINWFIHKGDVIQETV